MGDCNDLNNVEGKIVVCESTYLFWASADNIDDQITSGAAGGIFLYVGNRIEPHIHLSFPAVVVSMEEEEGQAIFNYINTSHDPRATMKFPYTRIGTKAAPRVAISSSRGPSTICPNILKPDLMAPGSLVLGSCGSGCTFERSSAAIRSAIMTTADTLDNTLSPITEFVDNVQQATPLAIGAGHLNPSKALDPGLIYDATAEDYVRLLFALDYTVNQIKKITRSLLTPIV
uniref:Uncharacterized protein n=1 Tax=Nelumbo nucifera TaxID=4432 RepID=A0A822XVQ9_NELNU|nr:TPA_asm: hypothetical protein HUJ06_022981 [Nelumbo nucifera]